MKTWIIEENFSRKLLSKYSFLKDVEWKSHNKVIDWYYDDVAINPDDCD